MIHFNETMRTAYGSPEESQKLRQVGLTTMADSDDRGRLKYDQEILAEKVKLGYAYLDAGCRPEARAVFNEVWAKNSPEFTVYAQQAREALNLMNSKGQ